MVNATRDTAAEHPSGAATPQNSDAHERIAVPKALCLSPTHPPMRKTAKYAVLTPGRAGFPNHAKRSEGRDSTPIQNVPVSPCEPLCAILLAKVSVYPPQSLETNVAAFVPEVLKAV